MSCAAQDKFARSEGDGFGSFERRAPKSDDTDPLRKPGPISETAAYASEAADMLLNQAARELRGERTRAT